MPEKTLHSFVRSAGRIRSVMVPVQVVAERTHGEQVRLRGPHGIVIEGLVVDGAAELEKIARELNFKIGHCWSHARRNVLTAEAEAPVQVAQFLGLIAVLYKIEREVAGDGVDAAGGYDK